MNSTCSIAKVYEVGLRLYFCPFFIQNQNPVREDINKLKEEIGTLKQEMMVRNTCLQHNHKLFSSVQREGLHMLTNLYAGPECCSARRHP